MPPTRRHTALGLIEVALPLVGAAAWARWGAESLPTADVLEATCWVGLAIAALLSVRLKRSRGLAMALLLGGGAAVLNLGSAPADWHLHGLIAGSALTLLVLSLLRERPPLSRPTAIRFASLVLCLGGAAWALSRSPEAQHLLMARVAGQPTALAIVAGAGLASAALALVRPGALERATAALIPALAVALWNAGSPPAHLWLLAAAISLLIALSQATAALAFNDELTGLPARRALEESLAALGGNYTLAMVDIDHFKRFNDRYGHDVGDQALRMVASHIARTTAGARAYRYGGEEFALIFPRTTAPQAAEALEATRTRIAADRFVVRTPKASRRGTTRRSGARKPTGVKVTVSIGVADAAGRPRTPHQVLKAADKQLYRAKRGGRNRVSCVAKSRTKR